MTTSEIIGNIKAKREEYELAAKAALEPYVAAFFEENPDVPKVVILGWTPGFNDGDPCVHTQAVLITPSDFEDHGIEDERDVPKYGTPGNPKYGTPERKALEARAAGFDVLQDVLHDVHGTNFQLTFTRDGKVEKDFYDCGY